MNPANLWRPLIAVLANPQTRRVAAELMLGTSLESATSELSPSKRRRVTDAIAQSGLIDPETGEFNSDVFRTILESDAVPKPQGIERFFDGKQIRQYPSNLEERGQLLAKIAHEVFQPGEALSERKMNERLLPYSEDVAVLRRYLVDYDLVERRSDGSEYALTGRGPVVNVA